jgi:hypothetical protein
MNRLEYLKELKKALYKLLTNGEDYYFIDALSEEKFWEYTQDYLIQKPKYKGNYWFTIDKENFMIKLQLPDDIKKYFKNNLIPNFINNLAPLKFERISSILMKKLLGSLIVEESLYKNDDGIDFYGKYISDGVANNYTDYFQTNTWYIGQVKQYKEENSIGTKYIRELLGTIELAKNRIWSVGGSYKDINLGINEAIIPIFITSSRYSSDTVQISKKFNIKLLDEVDLIFWLSLLYDGNLESITNDLNNWDNA